MRGGLGVFVPLLGAVLGGLLAKLGRGWFGGVPVAALSMDRSATGRYIVPAGSGGALSVGTTVVTGEGDWLGGPTE